MRHPLILAGPFFPSHAKNRMHHEGDVAGAREEFLKRRFRNLETLLEQRYGWMNEYIVPGDVAVEFGSGAGLSKLFIRHDALLLTDYVQNPWIDRLVDAMDPPFAPNSIDVIICSHMVHHMARPVQFFRTVHPLLRQGGRILIQELNTALVLRALLRLMRHEGWSYDIDVFNETTVANDPVDPWSANCAIPELLFRSSREFERRVPGYEVIKNDLNECLLFPLSGGVTAKVSVPELPRSVLEMIGALDKLLVRTWPGMFALGRSVVLEKRPIS